MAAPRLLIIETSYRIGHVALAEGGMLLGERTLDDSRRHASDLVPAVHSLLGEHGIKVREIDGVLVSRGPGSYTGLRVGIMSAKTFAYVTGCALLAIDTFAAIHAQAPTGIASLDVLGDAQQGNVYAQCFGDGASPLRIVALSDWLAETGERTVTGPALVTLSASVVGATVLPAEYWHATAAGVLKVGLDRFLNGERDDLHAMEPLYLRASAAELQWDAKHGPAKS